MDRDKMLAYQAKRKKKAARIQGMLKHREHTEQGRKEMI